MIKYVLFKLARCKQQGLRYPEFEIITDAGYFSLTSTLHFVKPPYKIKMSTL